MNRTHRNILGGIGVVAFAAAFLLSAGAANAVPRYLDDGAIQRPDGGWQLPEQGTCPADAGLGTRPECLALRYPAYTTDGTGTGACRDAAADGTYRSWSTGVCNDLDPAVTDESSCEAKVDRLWSNGVCSIVMLGDDRNNVVCAQHGGTWVTTGVCTGNWIMPNGGAYTPDILNANPSAAAGTGDQCLRCHNSKTQYNGPRVRDTENFLYTGHKNMARKVTPGTPWGGPPFACDNPSYTDEQTCEDNGGEWIPTEYPTDDTGNVIDWDAGTYTTTSGTWSMAWIYGDWLAPFPRVIAKMPASSSTVCSDPRGTAANCVSTYGGTLINNAGASYSCARCHTTGWTSDATIATQAYDPRLTKEPERSFMGITWDRNSNAPANVVNMSGGVTGDANKYSSFDVWGISCSRCHNSAIETTKVTCYALTQPTCAGLGGTWAASTSTCTGLTSTQCVNNAGQAVYGSPDGMSTHHNDLTGVDVSTSGDKGYCSDARYTALAQCNSAGAAWLTACSKAGSCTNGAYTTSGTCVANGGSWTKYDSQTLCLNNTGTWNGTGCIGDATLTTQAACEGAAKVWRGTKCSTNTYTSQSACEADSGAEWYDSRCTVKGVCNDDAYSDSISCRAAGKQWAVASDIVRCLDLGGKWTGSKTNRGQIVTALCMNCHRQESGGMPFDNGSDPARALKVGQYHNTITYFSHPQANQFLNSPHARFTGTFAEIPTGANVGFNWTGKYRSYFMNDGEAANTGNGCTGCHDVHESVVEKTSPFSAIHEECTECHAGPYAKDLNQILHPAGVGTPLEEKDTNPSEACMTCHMPEDLHIFRINTASTYSMYPPEALTATATSPVNAKTQPDDDGYNAVWVDVDQACGQCHGGGSNHVETTGTISASSATLNVASKAGLAAGQRVRIADAGSLTYDEIGAQVQGDFDTYILSVSPSLSQVTLVGKATFAVSSVAVIQNPTKNGASYKNKTYLAQLANGIHSGVAVAPPYVNFSTSLDPVNQLKVYFNASSSTCSGSAANCDLYEWDFDNNGTVDNNSGPVVNYTYASAGAKTIKLTVTEYGKSGGVATKTVNTYLVNQAPTPGGMVCGSLLNASTWVASFTDASTDTDGTIAKVTVNWGDGTAVTTKLGAGQAFSHTYLKVGSFTVTQTAIDNNGKSKSTTCTAIAPAYFKLAGTVKNLSGSTNLASATVKVYNGATLLKTLTTNASGAFDTGLTLKPGAQYKLVVTKTGYTFTVPEWGPQQVGPSVTGIVINAN